jgi:hypothetical protein
MITVRPSACCKRTDQFDKVLAAVRIKTGRRFVEQEQLRLQRKGTGQGNALDHTTGEFGRHQAAMRLCHFNHVQFEKDQTAYPVFVQTPQFTQRKGNVIEH